jgi:hypothetical protein
MQRGGGWFYRRDKEEKETEEMNLEYKWAI